MALFSRRTIQSMVDDISLVIGRKQLKNIVHRLNSINSQSIEAEYELAVLVGFSKSGVILHEPDMGGSSRADLLFYTSEDKNDKFLADITCISQSGLGSRQPLRFLISEFKRLIEPYGIGIEGFHFQVGNIEDGPSYMDRRVKLTIPGNKQITKILEKEITKIANLVCNNKDEFRTFSIHHSGLYVDISYRPDNEFVGSGHRDDGSILSMERNPVYQKLVTKAAQLENTGYMGVKGIFLCDAGSHVFHDQDYCGAISPSDVFEYFFKTNHNISFICTLYTRQYSKQYPELSERKSIYKFNGKFMSNPSATHPISDSHREIVIKLPQGIPNAESNGMNAQNWISTQPQYYGRSFIGGCEMNNNSIKISARALQELLAGNLTQDDFLKRHGFIEDGFTQIPNNPFKDALCDGRLINNIEIDPVLDADDDWIKIHFGQPDPAISEIRLKKRRD